MAMLMGVESGVWNDLFLSSAFAAYNWTIFALA
jgi:hypothetical protein